jgi:putative transposase
MPVGIRRDMIETNHELSIRRQCALLGAPRSGFYYKHKGASDLDHDVMRMLDEQYTATPFYGVERMTAWLHRNGVIIGHNKVRRLMRIMGLEAIYPKPRLSMPSPGHKIYPYLLKNMRIKRPNQVWSTDITYIRLVNGFVYLVAIMDWFSRYVLSWRLSTSLDVEFCVAALKEALEQGHPDIFNSDQGSQFTSNEFTMVLKKCGIQISMDGRGRAFDNIFIERLWRTVKYEEVYTHDYENVIRARERIGKYFKFYNADRIHQSLGYHTPEEAHYGTWNYKPHRKLFCAQTSI